MKRVLQVTEQEWLGDLVVGAFYKTESGRVMKITALDRKRSTIIVED
jgi:hypothetical protein